MIAAHDIERLEIALPLRRSRIDSLEVVPIHCKPEHLSSYEVIYEEDTALFAQLQAGEFEVDEELACAMFDQLADVAGHAGFIQYEIANFARDASDGTSSGTESTAACAIPSRACRHNINYWRGGEYFGLGPSASEYIDHVRAKNWSNTDLYCRTLESGRRAVESREHLTPLARAGELAAFGLRMNAGWPFEQFRTLSGFDLREEWRAEMEELVSRAWGICSASDFRLTRQGLRFADAVGESFLRPELAVLMEAPRAAPHKPILHV